MQVAAIPLFVVAAIAVYVGVYHLYVAWRVPRRVADGAFGVLCLAAAFYAVVAAAPFVVTTYAAAVYVHHLGDSWGFLIAIAWLAFVHRYTGEGHVRRTLALSALVLAGILAVWWMPPDWVERSPEIEEAPFFGIPTRYYLARPEAGVLAVQLTGLAAFAETVRMVVRHVRSGDPRARPLAAATLFMTLTIAHDLYRDYAGGTVYFLLPYGILGAILAMAYMLSEDVLRTAIAERALRESEERFKIAVAGTSDGLFDWNLVSGEIYYSDRFAEILGVSPASLEVAGRVPFRCVDVRERESLEAAIETAIASGERLDVEAELGSGAATRWVRVRGQSVIVGDEPCRFAGAISDVTERRRAEIGLREAQKLESVGRLAGGVAHDFNNMLAGVVAFADLIRREKNLSPRALDAAGHIIEAGQRAGELTARLLAFSRQTSRVTADVDAHRAIEEALSLLERTVDRRIRIERDLGAARHVVHGDAAQIQSAVLNLGVNARDAMRDGGTLRISTRNETLTPERRGELGLLETATKALVLRVSDTGTGIAPEHVPRVFDPFYTTKALGEGTGLGLAAVRATVEEMGGAVVLDTAVGRGTTVELYLPTRDEAIAVERSPEGASSPRYEGVAIVIEDEATVREALRASVSSLGLSVVATDDGPSGVAQLRARRGEVALVVMDVILPKWSGEQTFRELRAVDPNVPILVVSGFSGETQVAELLRRGAAGFVAKPFRLDALFQAIERALGREPKRSRGSSAEVRP